MPSPTGVKAHDATVIAAENTRQNAFAVSTTQAQLNTATVTYYRAVLASKIANNLDVSNELIALKNLGVTV
jgi:hypothetical protein